MNNQINLGIIGTGLIGGSLGLALSKNKKYNISCWNRTIETSNAALEKNIVKTVHQSLESLLHNCDVAIICTPLSTYENIGVEISKLKNPIVVSDVGSVKTIPSQILSKSFSSVQKQSFVPAHPIAGKAISGLSAADETLYKGKKIILTSDKPNRQAENIIKQIWLDAGAEIAFLSPLQHDKIYAKVSHLPQLISFLLKDTQTYQALDFLRLTNSPKQIWVEIFNFNKDAIFQVAEEFFDKLFDFIEQLNVVEDNYQTAALSYFTALSNTLYSITSDTEKPYAGTGFKSFTSLSDSTSHNFSVSKSEKDYIISACKQLRSDYENWCISGDF